MFVLNFFEMKNSMYAAKGLANYFDVDIESVLNRIDKNYNLIDLIEDLQLVLYLSSLIFIIKFGYFGMRIFN